MPFSTIVLFSFFFLFLFFSFSRPGFSKTEFFMCLTSFRKHQGIFTRPIFVALRVKMLLNCSRRCVFAVGCTVEINTKNLIFLMITYLKKHVDGSGNSKKTERKLSENSQKTVRKTVRKQSENSQKNRQKTVTERFLCLTHSYVLCTAS